MQRYEVSEILALSAHASTPSETVLEFVEQFQQVTELLAARAARRERKKQPATITDDDGWTSTIKHEEDLSLEPNQTVDNGDDDGFAPAVKKKNTTMKVKTAASKMTRGGNGGNDNVALTQTKAFNAFAAFGGDDDDEDDE